jgi:hypothetical protein
VGVRSIVVRIDQQECSMPGPTPPQLDLGFARSDAAPPLALTRAGGRAFISVWRSNGCRGGWLRRALPRDVGMLFLAQKR